MLDIETIHKDEPLLDIERMVDSVADFVLGNSDSLPENLPVFTVARLKRNFGDDYRAGLNMVCGEISILPDEIKSDVVAYLCGYSGDDLDALLTNSVEDVIRCIDERFPPVSSSVIDVSARPVLRKMPLNLSSVVHGNGRTLTWQDDAACTQTDPDIFFPETDNREVIARAKAICSGCEVKEQCLEWALDNQKYGIAGGMTESARKELKRAMGHPDIEV